MNCTYVSMPGLLRKYLPEKYSDVTGAEESKTYVF